MPPLSKHSVLLLLSFLLSSTQAFPDYNSQDTRAFHLESRDPTALPRAAALQKVASLHRRHLANNAESLYARYADAYAEAEPEAETEASPIMSIPCTSGANCVNGMTSARMPGGGMMPSVAVPHRRRDLGEGAYLDALLSTRYAEADAEAEAIMSIPCTSGANCVNGMTSARMPGGGMMPSMAVPHRRRGLSSLDGDAYLGALLSARYAEADAEAEAIMSIPCTSGSNCVNGMTSARMPGGGMMPSMAVPHRRDIDGASASAYFDILEAREAEAEESYWY